MKQPYIRKIMLDNVVEQIKWSVWFIGIMMIIHLVISVLGIRFDFNTSDLFLFSITSTPIYMFVAGIIAGVYFFSFYIRQGVTRKNYFIGTALGVIILSAIITIVIMVLSLIGSLILPLFNITFNKEGLFYNLSTPWFVIMLFYVLNCYAYYSIGWLIYIAYYSFNSKIGFCSIIFAILTAYLHSLLWEDGIVNRLNKEAASLGDNYNFIIPIIGTLAWMGINLILIRLMTKKAAIKI